MSLRSTAVRQPSWRTKLGFSSSQNFTTGEIYGPITGSTVPGYPNGVYASLGDWQAWQALQSQQNSTVAAANIAAAQAQASAGINAPVAPPLVAVTKWAAGSPAMAIILDVLFPGKDAITSDQYGLGVSVNNALATQSPFSPAGGIQNLTRQDVIRYLNAYPAAAAAVGYVPHSGDVTVADVQKAVSQGASTAQVANLVTAALGPGANADDIIRTLTTSTTAPPKVETITATPNTPTTNGTTTPPAGTTTTTAGNGTTTAPATGNGTSAAASSSSGGINPLYIAGAGVLALLLFIPHGGHR